MRKQLGEMTMGGAWGSGLVLLCCGVTLFGQGPVPVMPGPPVPAPAASADAPVRAGKGDAADRNENLKFDGTPLEMVLQAYSERTGRTLLVGPKVPKLTITLRSQGALTREEYLEAIEEMLTMNGISLLKVGDRFLKVIPSGGALEEPMTIREDAQRIDMEDRSQLITQMITLKYVDMAEAKSTIQPVLHSGFGKIHTLNRINAIMVTDTAANVNRILQLIKQIDQPVEAREEPNIVQVRYAKASEMKKKLEEIIAQSKEEQKKVTVAMPKRSGSPGIEQQQIAIPPPIPGVIRPPAVPAPKAEPAAETMEETMDLAERGIIRGKVHIVADDRTNLLIIITTPENMKFFEKIIRVLDVETSPDVLVKVIRLEHADAETVASSLNTLIGGKPKEAAPTPPPIPEGQSPQQQAAALRDYVARIQQERAKTATQPPAGAGEALKSKIGELSADNIKLLPDKRSNSIVVMASASDFNQIQELVKCLDIMLAQVLVEAIILEVQLGDSIQTGVDWVQRAMVAYGKGSDTVRRSAQYAFTGAGGGGSGSPQNALTAVASPGGLSYYLTYFGLNLDAVVNMASSDSGTRVVASPVIVTHDNVEATINAGEQRYFYKGQHWVLDNSTSGAGHYEPDVESKNVGIVLTVKPHINEKGLVVMDIKQTIDELAEGQKIGDTVWPTTLHREMNASVSVMNRETIVLGGLVKQNRSKVSSGIPLLHKIPILGALFGYDKADHTRNEVIVFLTPYVMNTQEQVAAESRRRKLSMDTAGMWRRGWSDSPLAEPEAGKSGVEAIPADGAKKAEPREAVVGPAAKPAVAATAAETPVETPAAPAAKKPDSGKPVPDIDPELLEFIRSQEKRYEKAFQEADKQAGGGLEEPKKE